MARITVDDCLKRIPNRFQLTLTATYRARQLSSGASPMVEPNRDKFTVIALREISVGKIGIEVLRRLNSSGNKIPIIFLTAKDATEDKVHGLTIGGDDYVTKPFSIEELMARVRVVLRRHGSGPLASRHWSPRWRKVWCSAH